MKRFTEQFYKESQKVRMRSFERADLRDRLKTYMEYHPLPAEMRVREDEKVNRVKVQASRILSSVHFNNVFIKVVAPALTVFVIIVVPVLAENAAPGDMLYPVKVRFNEEMRSRLASSPYEEIEWEAERIERRIAEARLLANEGKLTVELEAEVAAAVKEQTEKTKTKIAALKTTDSDEGAIAEITLASALEVQNEMLESDVEKNKAAGIETGNVLALVVAEESFAATAQQEQSSPSYEKLLARIETETTNAHELFASIKSEARNDEVVDIERRLADIAHKVNEAQRIATTEEIPEKVTEEDVVPEMSLMAVTSDTPTSTASTTEEVDNAEEVIIEEEDLAEEESVEILDTKEDATTILREALVDIRKLISFITNIDVRESVTVEELVPVTLTPEERYTTINDEIVNTERVLAEYEVIADQVSDEEIEGVKTSLADVLLFIKNVMSEANLDEAEEKLEEMSTLRTSLKVYLNTHKNEFEVNASLDTDNASSSDDVSKEEKVASSSEDVVLDATDEE